MSTITSSVPLLACMVGGNTRIASGKIAWSDSSRKFDVQAFDFSLVNFASSNATSSWSSPRVDDAISYGDRHGVLSINALNFKPTEAMSADWVDNQNFLISNEDVRAMHNQVEEGSARATNDNRYGTNKKAGRRDSLHDHESNKDVHNPGANNAGFGLELLTTTHSSILTQGVQNV